MYAFQIHDICFTLKCESNLDIQKENDMFSQYDITEKAQ